MVRCGVCLEWKLRQDMDSIGMRGEGICISCATRARVREAIKTIPAAIRRAVRNAFRGEHS